MKIDDLKNKIWRYERKTYRDELSGLRAQFKADHHNKCHPPGEAAAAPALAADACSGSGWVNADADTGPRASAYGVLDTLGLSTRSGTRKAHRLSVTHDLSESGRFEDDSAILFVFPIQKKALVRSLAAAPLCCAVLCCAVLRCAVLCCVVLYIM
jgi:hypothetical protein